MASQQYYFNFLDIKFVAAPSSQCFVEFPGQRPVISNPNKLNRYLPSDSFIVSAAKYQKEIWDEGTEPTDAPQMETWIHDYCEEYFESETKFYDWVKPLQGRDVPRLLATVSYELCSAGNPAYQHFLSVPGIIMEFFDGFSLFEMPTRIPKERWQEVIDSAVSTVDKMGAVYGVLNKDISSRRNIKVRMVQEDGGKTSYQVVFYDFALSSTRDGFKTEEEWLEAKRSQDERGAVGAVMQNQLNRAGARLLQVLMG